MTKSDEVQPSLPSQVVQPVFRRVGRYTSSIGRLGPSGNTFLLFEGNPSKYVALRPGDCEGAMTVDHDVARGLDRDFEDRPLLMLLTEANVGDS